MCDNKNLRKSEPSKKSKKHVETDKKAFRTIQYESDDDVDADDSEYETIGSDDSEEDSEEDDSDDEGSFETAEDEEGDEEELQEVIKLHKLHKFVAKLYPSKYTKEKVKNDKKYIQTKKCNKHDSEYEDEEEKKFNIILNLSGNNDEYNSEYESDDDISEKKDENSEDDEKVFMKENYTGINNKEPEKKTTKKGDKKINRNLEKEFEKEKNEDLTIEEEYAQLSEMKRELTIRLQNNPKNKYYTKMFEGIKQDIKKLVEKGRKKNTKEFYKLINAETKRKSELEYFEKKLSHKEQQKIVKELKVINDSLYVDKPYRLAVLQSNMPEKVKAVALQKLNTLKMMEPGDPEYFKMKNWVDAFMKIPFGQHKNLPVSIDDGIDTCHEFMEKSHTILNECTYGMTDAKMQVMQLVGQWITNPQAMGNAIALKGAAGIGKTSLVKDGISKILGRDFIFIPLGGCGDGSYLEGNSYVYEGSSYGKIIQSIIQCQSMNPVIYFDELDKISDSPRGQEIIGILTHLTDTTQNGQFHDKYFSDIDFPLDKCLFIFSYNDESLINPILRDRMYKIMVSGYQVKEKVIIGKNYLIPKILKEIKFTKEDIIISDSVLSYIAEKFTNKEEGVRNLKRCLEIIYTKLNLFRLVKPETATFFSKEIDLKIQFPHNLTTADVDVLIKTETNKNNGLFMMYT
jgi:ATP-dependent Lon protease